MHGDGRVTIRTSQTPRSVVIEVKDEGRGVPPDLVHRIFERSVSGAGGTGLGLALAKSMAASDGGQLVLVRPRPATFAVIFPQPVRERLDEPVVAGPAEDSWERAGARGSGWGSRERLGLPGAAAAADLVGYGA